MTPRPHMSARKILDALRRDGWRIEPTRKGHLRLYSPCGRFLITASGNFEGRSADRNALPNFLRDLRVRAGWTPPG